jgi:hypothetical protein
MMQTLEGFKFGFGAMMGGAAAVLVLYMLSVVFPGVKKLGGKKGRGWS